MLARLYCWSSSMTNDKGQQIFKKFLDKVVNAKNVFGLSTTSYDLKKDSPVKQRSPLDFYKLVNC